MARSSWKHHSQLPPHRGSSTSALWTHWAELLCHGSLPWALPSPPGLHPPGPRSGETTLPPSCGNRQCLQTLPSVGLKTLPSSVSRGPFQLGTPWPAGQGLLRVPQLSGGGGAASPTPWCTLCPTAGSHGSLSRRSQPVRARGRPQMLQGSPGGVVGGVGRKNPPPPPALQWD